MCLLTIVMLILRPALMMDCIIVTNLHGFSQIERPTTQRKSGKKVDNKTSQGNDKVSSEIMNTDRK